MFFRKGHGNHDVVILLQPNLVTNLQSIPKNNHKFEINLS